MLVTSEARRQGLPRLLSPVSRADKVTRSASAARPICNADDGLVETERLLG
jgi:hypothetical protein